MHLALPARIQSLGCRLFHLRWCRRSLCLHSSKCTCLGTYTASVLLVLRHNHTIRRYMGMVNKSRNLSSRRTSTLVGRHRSPPAVGGHWRLWSAEYLHTPGVVRPVHLGKRERPIILKRNRTKNWGRGYIRTIEDVFLITYVKIGIQKRNRLFLIIQSGK